MKSDISAAFILTSQLQYGWSICVRKRPGDYSEMQSETGEQRRDPSRVPHSRSRCSGRPRTWRDVPAGLVRLASFGRSCNQSCAREPQFSVNWVINLITIHNSTYSPLLYSIIIIIIMHQRFIVWAIWAAMVFAILLLPPFQIRGCFDFFLFVHFVIYLDILLYL